MIGKPQCRDLTRVPWESNVMSLWLYKDWNARILIAENYFFKLKLISIVII